MKLEWALCHQDGTEKDWIWDRRVGSYVEVAVSEARAGQVVISTEEQMSKLVHPGRSRMKVWFTPRASDGSTDKLLLMNALVLEPQTTWTDATIPIADQSHRLLNQSGAIIVTQAAEDAFDTAEIFTTAETSEQMWRLIRRSDRHLRYLIDQGDIDADSPTNGIIEGTLADTGHTRTWYFGDARTTWDSILAKSRRRYGPDFELNPLDREDGVFAEFNTFYPKQGEDKTDLIFKLGENMVDIEWSPTIVDPGLCNQYVCVGDQHGNLSTCYVAEDKNSIEDLGLYTRIETVDTVRGEAEADMADLQEQAEAYIAHHNRPRNLFNITLPAESGGTARGWSRDANGNFVTVGSQEFGIPPAFGIDYWVGDTITLEVHDRFRFQLADEEQPGPGYQFQVRVTKAKITEVDSAGTCVVELEVYEDDDEPDGISGYQAFIYIDAASDDA